MPEQYHPQLRLIYIYRILDWTIAEYAFFSSTFYPNRTFLGHYTNINKWKTWTQSMLFSALNGNEVEIINREIKGKSPIS